MQTDECYVKTIFIKYKIIVAYYRLLFGIRVFSAFIAIFFWFGYINRSCRIIPLRLSLYYRMHVYFGIIFLHPPQFSNCNMLRPYSCGAYCHCFDVYFGANINNLRYLMLLFDSITCVMLPSSNIIGQSLQLYNKYSIFQYCFSLDFLFCVYVC